MSRGQTDVLVEMKGLNLCPVDTRSLGQPIQELELGGSRGGDDPRPAMLRNRAPNRTSQPARRLRGPMKLCL